MAHTETVRSNRFGMVNASWWKNRKSLIATQFFILSALLLIYVVGTVLDVPDSIYPKKLADICLLFEMAFALMAWWKTQPGILSPFALFLLMLAITHASVPLINLLGLQVNADVGSANMIYALSAKNIWEGSFVISIFTSSLMLGALSVSKNDVKRCFHVKVDERLKENSIFNISIIILIFGVICFILYFASIGRLAGGNYNSYFSASDSSGTVAYNGIFFLVSGALGVIVTAKKRHYIIIAAACLAAWVIFFLSLGSRNKTIFVAIAAIMALRYRNIKIPRSVVYFGLLGFFLLSVPYSQYRLTGKFALFVIGHKNAIYQLAVSAIEQIGIYYYITCVTVKQYTEVWNPNLGLSYVNALFFAIPLGQRIYFNKDLVGWVANLYYPSVLASNPRFGTGFSFIAEAFEAFSWFGVGVVFIIGRYISKISLAFKLTQSSTFFALATLIFVLFFVRDSSYGFIRGIVWYGYLPLLSALIFKGVTRRINHARF